MSNYFNKVIRRYIKNQITAEELFFNCYNRLEGNFGIPPVNKNIRVIVINKFRNQVSSDLVSYGVTREIKKENYEIHIMNYKFTPFLLLKEVYLCFLPNQLKKDKVIHIILNELIYQDLKGIKNLEEYITEMRKKVISYDFLKTHLDRIDKFFELKKIKDEIPQLFLLKFLRNNYRILNNNHKSFYNLIFKDYILLISKNLKNDIIIETVRILIIIFEHALIFSSLTNYVELFKKYQNKKFFETILNQEDFKKNLRWLRDHSYIAPSYQINWRALKELSICYKFSFNPNLGYNSIKKIIEKLPFNIFSKVSFSSFSVNLEGYFVIPENYRSDLNSLIRYFEEKNVLIDFFISENEIFLNNLNLNYFREFHNYDRILNPNHVKYEKKYETSFDLNYARGSKIYKLDLFDWLLIDRLRYWSITGFGFKHRAATISQIKKDLLNQIVSERALIKTFNNITEDFYNDYEIKDKLIRFINHNKKFGFFFILELLERLVLICNILEDYFIEDPNKKRMNKILDDIQNHKFTESISNNIVIKEHELRTVLSRDFIPFYINDRNKYQKKKKQYQKFLKFFKTLKSIKILDLNLILNIIQNPEYPKKIVKEKKKNLQKSYNIKQISKITKKTVENRIRNYVSLDYPIAIPAIQSTINTTHFANFFLRIILKTHKSNKHIYPKIQKFFPRLLVLKGKKITFLEIYLPNISNYEKFLLVSVFLSVFGENLISVSRYLHDGIYKQHSLKTYYDFKKKEFFYTKDLFSETKKYYEKFIKKDLKIEQTKRDNIHRKNFFINDIDFYEVSKVISERISQSSPNFNKSLLNDLDHFNQDLFNLIRDKAFKNRKEEDFYDFFIDKIAYYPNFQKFGLSKYILYIRPKDMEDVDFKLLFTNSFDNIQYPASVQGNIPLLISYLFPFRTPNKTYLNLLAKSKHSVLEYCLFRLKKFHNILHFEYNLTNEGWNLNPNYFKTFAKKILFDKDFSILRYSVNTYHLDKKSTEIFGKYSEDFKNLKSLYEWEGLDLKSYLGTHFKNVIRPIKNLLKKQLIIPYIRLKNLELIEELLIILPNIPKKEDMKKLIKIFSFFNVVHIFEIAGEFFIDDRLPMVESFQNGLFIKLYLPKNASLSDFQNIFIDIFELLDISHFLILPDYTNGETLINNIYREQDILKKYNPYKNLNWNEKDKKWMNIKLFGENLEKKYPSLIPNKD